MTAPIAQQLIQRIVAKTGAAGRTQTVDHVSAGDPALAVTGIAVTAMASLDVLKAAAVAGRNLVITYDPGFWSTADDFARLEASDLFVQKRDFIHAHDLVVFNLHDHWRDRMPDGIAAGMAKTLGWEPDAANANLFRRPPTTLVAMAHELSTKLNDRTLRVVGVPRLPVNTIATSFGDTARLPGIALLNGPADVVVCGYAHEWETVEYAQDLVTAGVKKGLILLGENASVGAGMQYCADWIKTLVPEVPVEFFAAPEPYWNVP
jgi:putative NIF3 family GTP cyclohydrolase 1 type 2